jgi:hypothetical protein
MRRDSAMLAATGQDATQYAKDGLNHFVQACALPVLSSRQPVARDRSDAGYDHTLQHIDWPLPCHEYLA